MKRIGLVGCGAGKLAHPEQAQFLYTGTLFRLARLYAIRHCAEWWILSAKHGLLSPQQLTAPYDVTLAGAPPAARAAWGLQVAQALTARYAAGVGTELVLLAGSAYEGFVPHVGNPVTTPLGRLPLGKRLAWLKQHMKDG